MESEISKDVSEIIKLEISLPEEERRDENSDIEKWRLDQIKRKDGVLSDLDREILDRFRSKKTQYFIDSTINI